jgi:tetratricopeptide (TPR) repeat protein
VGRLWDAATSVTGSNERLVRWVQVQSGMELSPEGATRALDETARKARSESLAKLGGPLLARLEEERADSEAQALRAIDGGNWRAAVWHLDRQILAHPNDALAFALRANARLEQDERGLAAQDFERALALGPPERVLPHFRAFASEAIQKQRTERAIWYLDRLIAAAPADGFAWLARGRLRGQHGQWQDAAADMARGIALDPAQDTDWLATLPLQLYAGDIGSYGRLCGSALDRFGETPEAVIAERIAKACMLLPLPVEHRERVAQLADRAVESGYRHYYMPSFEIARGMSEYRAGRFQSAVDWLQKSRGASGWIGQLPAQSFLAMACYYLGQPQKSRQAMDKARQFLAQIPKSVSLNSPMAGFPDWIIGQLCYREAAALMEAPHRAGAEECLANHDWQAALGHLKHLTETGQGSWADWVSRSCASYELDRASDANGEFAQALTLAQDQPYPWLKRGRFHADRGRPAEAAADFAKGLEVMAERTGWERERAAICRDLISAQSSFAKLIELRPQDAGLYAAQAWSAAERKSWDEAIRVYDKAVELKPGDPRLRLERAACLANLGRWKPAASDYAKGLECNPGEIRAWYEAAIAHIASGDRDGFARICTRMWDRFGKTVNLQMAQLVAYTLVQTPEPKAGVSAVGLEMCGPGGGSFGAVLYRNGKWEEAARELEQAASSTTPFRQAWCWVFLAMTHRRLGHAGTAREYLDKAQRWRNEAGAIETGETTWPQQVELDTLRREAEDLLKDKPPEPRKQTAGAARTLPRIAL